MASRKKKAAPVDLERQAKLQKTLELLKKVRESKTVELKPSRFMRTQVTSLDGSEQPFNLRYYQVQGAYHLLALQRMVLGDDTGLGKCQPAETLVLTNKGLVRLGDIADSATMKPDSFRDLEQPLEVLVDCEARAVRRFYFGGVKPTLRVTTRRGFQNAGTVVHPMLVLRRGRHEWVRMQDLAKGDHVCVERREMAFPEQEPPLDNAECSELPARLTPPLARFLGFYLAEGSLNNRYQVCVSQSPIVNPEIHALIQGLLVEIFGREPNATGRGGVDLRLGNVRWRRYLAANGLDYRVSKDLQVPPCILQASRVSTVEFLRAFFEGEGSVVPSGLELTTASQALAIQLQVALLRFGIVACRRPKRVKGRDHVYWRLTIFGNDAVAFQERLGFMSPRKRDALAAALSRQRNSNQDVVPGIGVLIERARAELSRSTTVHGANDIKRGSGLHQFGSSLVNTFNGIRNGGRQPTYAFLEKLCTLLHQHSPTCQSLVELRDLLRTHYFYDPIVALEAGEEPVFDIEVDHADHSFVGNGIVNHNTIEAIAAFSHMMERNPQVRVVIVTLKSTVRQWAREIERFTTDIRPVIVETRPRTKDGKSPLDQRKESYAEWLRPRPEGERAVLILNYALMIRDWNAEGVVPVDEKGNPDPKKPVIPGVLDQVFLDATKDGAKLVVIYDEAQVFANDRTKTSEIGRFLSDRAERVYGLTATLHKSKLIEGYCIYKVIKPGVFTTKTAFMRDFCVTELQKVPGTARKIPIIVGYRNLEAYRNRIAPFYLGRRKQDVTDELPALIAKDVVCELSAAEDAKYQQALSGVLELGDGSIKDYEENKALVALNYCQQVVNSLSMLKFDPGAEVEGELDFATLDTRMLKVGALGAKEEALVDLLSDGGELEGEKVIVYTRFASLVPRLQKMLELRRIKSVAITGAQNEKKRAAAQEAFQNARSDVAVVFITTAGGVGINLQQARAMVFYELPWTWGDYVQLLGRMIRIGSPHKGVVTYHLMAERPRAKKNQTIDHHVYKLLREKKALIDQVIGEAAVGALDFAKDSRGVRALFDEVLADARAIVAAP